MRDVRAKCTATYLARAISAVYVRVYVCARCFHYILSIQLLHQRRRIRDCRCSTYRSRALTSLRREKKKKKKKSSLSRTNEINKQRIKCISGEYVQIARSHEERERIANNRVRD